MKAYELTIERPTTDIVSERVGSELYKNSIREIARSETGVEVILNGPISEGYFVGEFCDALSYLKRHKIDIKKVLLRGVKTNGSNDWQEPDTTILQAYQTAQEELATPRGYTHYAIPSSLLR
jgi:hypothetical protein